MIRLVVTLTAKPGRRDELLAAFQANVPAVRAEKGCVEYGAFLDTPGAGPIQTPIGPDTIMILETWDSLESLAAHGAAPHMKEFGRKTKDMLESRVIHVLTAA